MSLEPPYQMIGDLIRDGKVVPFLGAGASLHIRPAGALWQSPKDQFLPKAEELAQYLKQAINYPKEEAIELTRVAQYFDGVTGRPALNAKLNKIFSREYTPTSLHHFLAAIPSNLLIVTTNYDDLLERAFLEQNRPFELVIYDTENETVRYQPQGSQEIQDVWPNECLPDLEHATVIFKMHGTFDQPDSTAGSFVIAEDDYVEFLARMSQMKAVPAAFAETFKKSHFLFLGYGLQDWNLRVILHRIWKGRRQGPQSWAIQHQASDLDKRIWITRGLEIYEMTIEEFLHKLKQSFHQM